MKSITKLLILTILFNKIEIIASEKVTEDKVAENKVAENKETEDIINLPEKVESEQKVESSDKIDPKILEDSLPPVGLNTVDTDEEGNWLLKKLWWQEAKKAFTDLQLVNDNLLNIQFDYLTIKSNSERDFDNYWFKLGLDEVSLNDNLKSLYEKIENEKKARSDLSEAERIAKTKIEATEKELQSLTENLEKITQYQLQLDEVLKDLTKYLKTCRNYESTSWDLLQKIAQTLDDEKAREYYLQIEVDLKNSKNLSKYLEFDLKKYMNQIIENQNSSLNNLKEKLTSLSNMGYKLTKVLNLEEKTDKSLIETREKNKEDEIREKKHQEALKKAAEKKKGFWSNLGHKISSWF